MIVLGIDPGLAITGYGLLKKTKNEIIPLCYGSIITLSKLSLAERIELIYKELKKIIIKHRPSCLAVEELFFCKNVKTALKVGQARGAVLLIARQNKLPIYEFTPLQVKQAVTGYGRAEKKQIQKMIKILLKLKEIPKPDDTADALAVALCCVNSL